MGHGERGPARARHAQGDRDWTPVVLGVTTVSLAVVAAVFVAERLSPAHPSAGDPAPGPVREERAAPADVDLWVGEPAPGFKLVLTGVWGDEAPDRAHDRLLAESLAPDASEPPAWYALLLFNASGSEQHLVLRDGALVAEAPEGAARLTSLAERARRGGLALPPALTAVLRGLGALAEDVHLGAGDSTRLLVCFDRRVDLASVQRMTGADGTAYRRRRMSRTDLQRLVIAPEASLVSTL